MYSSSDSIFFLDAGLGCEYFTFRIFSNSFCSHGMEILLLSSADDSSGGGGSFASVAAFVLLLVRVRVLRVVAIVDDFAPAERIDSDDDFLVFYF